MVEIVDDGPTSDHEYTISSPTCTSLQLRRNTGDNIFWVEMSFDKLHVTLILLQRDCTQRPQNGCRISRLLHLVTLNGNQKVNFDYFFYPISRIWS